MHELTCKGCSKAFDAERRRAYCVPDCRLGQYDACLDCGTRITRVHSNNKGRCKACAGYGPRQSRACRRCGAIFMRRGHARQGYCSRACVGIPEGQRANRGKRRDMPIDKIGARDNWRCHLCKKKVVRRQASVDHLIPFAMGGSDNETNLALAHKRCNFSRGAGRLPAQLRLGATDVKVMMIAICRYCGEGFTKAGRRGYCDAECARAAQRVASRSAQHASYALVMAIHRWERRAKGGSRTWWRNVTTEGWARAKGGFSRASA
jgi:5-methylcytosine-specific restriction endonuclease McrA